MTRGEKLRVLDPVGDLAMVNLKPAPRLETLDGKVIGLYGNNKLNAEELLDRVQELLTNRHQIKSFVRGNYSAGKVHKREEWSGIDQCDAIILTHGD
ncbi:hypothetical protein MK489_04020 [Myxococcota bacterium]|nr:hypothetical protein [Myxococcota bacterium]